MIIDDHVFLSVNRGVGDEVCRGGDGQVKTSLVDTV